MEERGGRGPFIVFHVRGLPYACRLSEVREIVSSGGMIPLPNGREEVSGLCNLRGEVVPVIDMERLLFPPPHRGEASMIMVVDLGEAGLGLLVQDVDRIEGWDPGARGVSPAGEDVPPFIREVMGGEGSVPIPVVEMDLLAAHLEGRGVSPAGGVEATAVEATVPEEEVCRT